MKKYIIFSILAIYMLVAACDDRLDIQPVNDYTEQTVITDLNSAKSVLNGIRKQTNMPFISRPYVGFYESIRAGYAYEFYNNTLTTLEYNSDFSNAFRVWNYQYRTIGIASSFINGMKNANRITEEDKKILLAEAKFLRGFAFWRTLKCFGIYWDIESEDGILLKTGSPDLLEEDFARSSVAETYDQILEDMSEVDLIPEFSDAKIMNRTAAKIIKAQVYLNRGIEGDYQKAYDIVNEILPDIDVENKTNLANDYAGMFMQLWDNPEGLFVSYTEESMRSPFSMWDYYAGSGAVYFLPKLIEGLWPECVTDKLDEEGNPVIDEEGNVVQELVDLETMSDSRMRGTMSRYNVYGRDQYPRKFCYTKGMDYSQKLKVYCTTYLRWGEIYLMKAELMSRLGMNLNDAIIPINKLRERAGALPFETPGTIDEFNKILYEEYVRELLGEIGQEYWAGIRIKINGKMARETFQKCIDPWRMQYEWLKLEDNELFKLVYPIPDQELVYNKLIHQTKGHF